MGWVPEPQQTSPNARTLDMLATHADREREREREKMHGEKERMHAAARLKEKAIALSLCIAQSLEKTQRKRRTDGWMDGWGGEIQGT
jgi:hypothetical protein